MPWFLSKLTGWLFGAPPKLLCSEALWRNAVAELAARTNGGRRESGAYILGVTTPKGEKRIREFVFYDDIDPMALASGVVRIRQTALPRLWAHCRERGYGVIADVHVHPCGYGQSESDRANPVMPRKGHIALILPDFAHGNPRPGGIGVYEFKKAGVWENHSKHGADVIRLEQSNSCSI